MLSRLFQRIHNDISKPLCMKTFFFGNIIARKFRFSAASQLQRSTTSTISIPRVFLEQGSDIPDESKRIKGRHCWSFLEKRSSWQNDRLSFSLFLSIEEKSSPIEFSLLLPCLSRDERVPATMLYLACSSVKGKLVTMVTNGEAGKVLARFIRFLGRRWCGCVQGRGGKKRNEGTTSKRGGAYAVATN